MAHARKSPSESTAESSKPADGVASGATTLLWGPGGFSLLIVLGIFIAREERWTLAAKDAAYWCVVAAMVVARTVAARRFGATGGAREGSPMRGVARYALTLVVVAGLAWVLAQSVRV